MENFLAQIFTNFSEFFKSLDITKRVSLITTSFVALGIVIGIISWAAKTHYKVLYTDLNNEDSSKIARLLKEKKISYQLADGGKTIRVPEDQVEIFRLELAKQGVSFSGTVGYEVFDKQSFGTTNFVQKVNKQRALEGELMKTMKYIRGIRRARVHLNIPDKSPFVSEQKPSTASVLLEVEDGVTLTHSEVRGIQQLVAAGVDGMRVQHVFVSDSRGKRLSDNISDRMTEETANKIDLEAKMSRRLEKQVEEILTRVVGSGKVIAKVSVNMDFTQKVATETTYDGENTAVLAEVANTQKLVGTRPSPQGIPGARSNLPGEKPQPGIPETKNDINKELRTKNYNVPSKVTKSNKPTASLQNISVAVMVDGKQVPILDKEGAPVLDDNGITKTQYEPWSEAEIENFQEIVASTLGLKNQRGDKVVIKNMEFIKEDFEKAEALLRARENRELIKNLVKYLAIGTLISMFFFMVIRPFIQWVTENTVESIEDFLPKTLEELEKIQANQKLPGLEDALPQIEEKLNPEKVEGNMLKEKIVTLVENNPSKAAQVIHELIHSGEGSKEIA